METVMRIGLSVVGAAVTWVAAQVLLGLPLVPIGWALEALGFGRAVVMEYGSIVVLLLSLGAAVYGGMLAYHLPRPQQRQRGETEQWVVVARGEGEGVLDRASYGERQLGEHPEVLAGGSALGGPSHQAGGVQQDAGTF